MGKIDPSEAGRSERLAVLLRQLAEQGLSQQEVALRTGVPPQYLSDVKMQRRSLTELFARRLGEEFHVDYLWLMSGQGSSLRPSVSGKQRTETDPLMLPLLPTPVVGNPLRHKQWAGKLVPIVGAAALAAEAATDPYILRLGRNDQSGRLRIGDLLLISQQPLDEAQIGILQHRGKLVIARRAVNGSWTRLRSGRALAQQSPQVGSCIAIVWADLLTQDSVDVS